MSRSTLEPLPISIEDISDTYIPLKKDNKLQDSPLRYDEGADEVISSSTIRSDIVAPTGSISFEDVLRLSSNSDTMEIDDCVRDERHEVLTEVYDDSGSKRPQQSVKGPLQTFEVQILDDDESGDFESIFPILNDFHWSKIVFKPREIGTGVFTIRDTDENGCILITKTEVNVTGARVNSDQEIDLENRVKLFIGQQVWIKYEGPAIAGHNYVSDPIWGTQFVPFSKTVSQLFENKDIALVEDLDSMGDMSKSVYDPTNAEDDAFSMDNMLETAISKVFTNSERTKLSSIESGAEVNQTDSEIKTQYEANANTNGYTDAEKSKLAGLESSKFLGEFVSLSALETAHPSPIVGSYANVDAGPGNDVERYVWDDDDSQYILQLGESTILTDAQIKTQYENNPDTNAFTDAEKTNLSNQSGSNSGDVTLESGSTTQDSLDLSGQEVKANLVTQSSDGVMSQQDKIELDNISANSGGDGWISGLAVTEDSPKDTTILYGAGTYLINGMAKSIASAGSYDLANGYGSIDHYSGMTNDQHAFVNIYVDSDEVIKSIRGDVGEKGDVIFPPLQPSDSVCVAIVEIKVNSGGTPKDIDNKHIDDCRNAPVVNTDETVSVSVDDLTTGFLVDKLSNNGNVTFSIENPGGIEKIKADAPGGGSSVPPSILYTGTSDIDGLDITPLYPSGILWIDSTADVAVKSLQNGQDKQIIRVVSLSLKKTRISNDTGTLESIMVEGNADVIADKYGGATLIFNASKGNWYFIGIN